MRILLVEDDPMIAQAIKGALGRDVYRRTGRQWSRCLNDALCQ